MQITVNIALLNQQEREDLAGFIMTFGKERAVENESQQQLPFTLQPDVPEQAQAAPTAPTTGLHIVVPPVAEPAAPITTAVEASLLDSKGLPWDERIHSSSKSKTDAGVWRRKKGVTDEIAAPIEAQLRAIPGAGAAPAPPPATGVSVAPPPPGAKVAPTSAAAPAPAPPSNGREKYVKLIGIASKAKGDGKLNDAEIATILAPYGLKLIPETLTQPEIMDAVIEAVEAVIASKE